MKISRILKRAAFCSLLTLSCMAVNSTWLSNSVWAQARDTAKEKELIALIKNDATPGGDKAIACKELALHGGPDAPAALAPLLADPKLASWARIALEAIPGPEASAVLRDAGGKLNGRLLVGTLNSIGVRRDADSVEFLGGKLNDADVDAASAAAVALGRVGDATAEKLLRAKFASASGALKSAMGEGCILVAERRLADGQAGAAAEIYDEVRLADVAKPRIIEATRGAILARTGDAVPLLIEQITSNDVAMQRLGLTVAREMKGPQVTEALAAQVTKVKPELAAMVLIALADRGDKSALPAVLEAAKGGSDTVRQAAAEVLLSLGDASCVPTLLDLAGQSNKAVADAAVATLSAMQGDDINKALLAKLDSASGPSQRVLIDLVGARRINATAALRKATDSSDAGIRHAAIAALGQTIESADLKLLAARLNVSKYPEDLPVVQQSLRAAAIRMEDREAVAKQLSDAMSGQPAAVKTKLLEILAEVGGNNALQAMKAAFTSKDTALVDASSRLLGNWSNPEAGPVLLELAQLPTSVYTTRAMRGYIRLVRQFSMPEEQRVDMCRNAMKTAKAAAEQQLVVEVMERYPSIAMMDVAIAAQPLPAVKPEVRRAILMIAAKLPDSEEVKSRLNKVGEKPSTVEIVKAEYGSTDAKRDVTEALRKQLRNLPVIPLPAPSYNKSFGGDPAPNAKKQLTIEYRHNGKEGKATFDEDDPILLK
ncbi:MAG: HEAT repeat domain-containing protein [Pirellulales bacterium]